MSNNIFNPKRFTLLFKQHFIHNAQFLVLSAGAYIGIIFIVLSIVQVGNSLRPHELEVFQGFLIAFVTIFGILYVGHSFPAFRSKESTIHYLMVPASVLEKFVFEFISRIGFIVLVLPVLFWFTFNVQGFFFQLFTIDAFQSVGMQYLVILDVDIKYRFLLYVLVTSGSFLVLSLSFAGAATFTKQPLVKSLFAVALLVTFFAAYSYIMLEQVGVGRYNPPEQMMLVPRDEAGVFKSISAAFFVSTVVMLFVAFRKLKEREV